MKFFVWTMSIAMLLFSCNKNNHPKPDHSGMFIKFFGGAKEDAGYSVKESGDGGYIIVGSTTVKGREDKNSYIVKTDSDGNKIWDNSFGDVYDEEALDVKLDSEGNYLVVGYKKNDKDSSDFLLLKYSREGVLLWNFSYGLPERNEQARFVTTTSEGGVLIAGTRQQAVGSQMNMYLVKLNEDTVAWQKDLGLNALYDEIGTVVELPDNDLLWCGTVNRGNETDLRISRSSAYSNLKWDLSIGEADGKNQQGKEIQLVTDGNFIIGGTETTDAGHTGLLVKVNEYGTVFWQTQPGGLGTTVNSVYPSSDGGYILAGQKEDNYLLLKTNSDGNLSWEKQYGGSGVDNASKVIGLSNGGYMLIGTVFVANNTLIGLMSTDQQGEVNKK
jgi:hypothetical protein